MSSHSPRKSHNLQHLTTTFHHNNKSFSSVTSNTNSEMTFHSAHDHTQMELRPMSQPSTITRTIPRPKSPTKDSLPSPKIESIKMDRQDSGYSDTIHASPRTSTSSRRSSPSKSSRSPIPQPPTNPKPKRRTTNSSSHSSTKSTRPSTKRASRSSPIPTSTLMQTRNSVSGSSRRPSMARHTHSASTPYHGTSQTYQFFHFPTFDPISSSTSSSHPSQPQAQEEMSELSPPLHHPPPATTQYWTSDSTRRLEYAAIDAAGKGVKGFLIRCVPDCILPVEKRRTRFCGEDGVDEDAGSVRRYRLALPEEKSLVEQCREQRPGFLRRWTTFGRRRDSC